MIYIYSEDLWTADFHFSFVHINSNCSGGAEAYRGGMNVDAQPMLF